MDSLRVCTGYLQQAVYCVGIPETRALHRPVPGFLGLLKGPSRPTVSLCGTFVPTKRLDVTRALWMSDRYLHSCMQSCLGGHYNGELVAKQQQSCSPLHRSLSTHKAVQEAASGASWQGPNG